MGLESNRSHLIVTKQKRGEVEVLQDETFEVRLIDKIAIT